MREEIENVISLVEKIKEYAIEEEEEEARDIADTILELVDQLQFILSD